MARTEDDVATILEFFGIKLTTPNQQLAAVLKTDINALLRKDVKELFGKTRREGAATGEASPEGS